MLGPDDGSTSPRARPELISVIIPVRNGGHHIADQLAALAAQTYARPWELIVVDNGCTDSSVEIAERFRDRLPSLTIIDARQRRSLGLARQLGARAARGDLLAYCDADDVAAPRWLEQLGAGAAHADLVGGSNDFQSLNSERQCAWERAVQPTMSLHSGYDFLPYVSGGNCAIWADVARAVAWDASFAFGASDIELTWRVQLAGYRVAFVPDAVMQIRFRTRPALIARQHFRYGMSEPYLFRHFRVHGMPRRELATSLRTWRWLGRNWHRLLSAEGRGDWLRLAGASSGRVWGSIRWRALYL